MIPLAENSKKTYPHLLDEQGVKLDTDGVPLCPQGMRMRHHQYQTGRHLHVYTCQAKRNTHRDASKSFSKSAVPPNAATPSMTPTNWITRPEMPAMD